MADFPTFQELFRVGRDEILSRNTKITREAIERDGTDVNALNAASAAVGDEVIGQLVRVEKAVYLDSAQGTELDRLVFDRYGLTRKAAAPARGTVQFTSTTPAAVNFSIPVNTRLSTSDGRQFLTTASANYLAGSTGPVSVSVRSALAGISQQAAAGTITSLIDVIAGAPGDMVVTNPLATAGADNEELDDSLRDRARLFFTTARRGTIDAVEVGALAVPGVRKATVFEAVDQFGRPAKFAQLIISDAFTEQLVTVDPTPITYQAQSQVLAETVFINLSNIRPVGIFIDVLVASVALQGVLLALAFQAGVSVDSVALQARAAIVAYMNSLAPGETFFRSTAIAKLRVVTGLVVTGNEIVSPAGDVIASPLQVLRTTMGIVVANTIQPDRALQGSTNPDAV